VNDVENKMNSYRCRINRKKEKLKKKNKLKYKGKDIKLKEWKGNEG
jgi:hypothetical protein